MRSNVQQSFRRKLTDPRFKEAIRQPLYDTLDFDSGVTTELRFFSVPQGQSGKTRQETNLDLAGQLSKGQKFAAQGVELHLLPGSSAAAYVRQEPVRQNAAVAAPQFANDIWALAQAGHLEINIGSKNYLTAGPLLLFPPSQGILIAPAVEQNLAAAAAQSLTSDYARMAGRPFAIDPELPIEENNNFSVVIKWPAAFALPSGFDARIKCVLLGVLFRN
jgi:hypothetical protein